MNHRKFIAVIAAAALSFAGWGYSSAPAHAGSDTARVITGIAVGAIIGAAIADSTRGHQRNRGHHGVTRSYGGHHGGHIGNHHRPKAHHGAGHYRPKVRHHGGHVNRGHGGHGYGKVTKRYHLPAECRVQSGSRYGYSGRCLSNSYAGYNALPHQCAVRIGGHHGTVYRDGCLSGYGYPVGRR